MRIYTKTGDAGTTAIWGGKRLPKDHPQIEAYGSIDELSCFIGAITTHAIRKKDKTLLTQVQEDLYIFMSILSGADSDIAPAAENVQRMEKTIDEIDKKKPVQNAFILMQGPPASISCHIARTVCRRAERRVVSYLKTDTKISRKSKVSMLQYLNRLSDLLFALGRKYHPALISTMGRKNAALIRTMGRKKST